MNMTDEILNSWTDADEHLADRIERCEANARIKRDANVTVTIGANSTFTLSTEKYPILVSVTSSQNYNCVFLNDCHGRCRAFTISSAGAVAAIASGTKLIVDVYYVE